MSKMHSGLSILTVIAVSMAIAWYVFDGHEGSIEWHPQLVATATAQSERERLFRVVDYERVAILGEEEGPGMLYGSLFLKMSHYGHVFIADFGDFKIKEFSSDGKFLNTYGTGHGQGPGEFSAIADFYIAQNKDVLVLDPNNGRVVLFDSEGRHTEDIKINFQALRIAAHSDSSFSLATLAGSSKLFTTIDLRGEVIRNFGKLINNHEKNSSSLQGWIEPRPGGGIFYAGRYAGIIASFNNEGELSFLTETIDPWPVPKIVRNSAGWTAIDQEAQISAQSLSSTQGELHIFTYLREGLRTTGVLDTYDSSNGRYLGSIRLPKLTEQALATPDGFLYTVSGVVVTKWKTSLIG